LHSVLIKKDSSIAIKETEILKTDVMDQLAVNCMFSPSDVKAASMESVWHISQLTGTPFAAADRLLKCMVRDGLADKPVPLVDIRWMPYQLAKIIIQAGNTMEVGPLLFYTGENLKNNPGPVFSVLCAAVKEQWQAPVLFTSLNSYKNIQLKILDWREILFKNSENLPAEPLNELISDIAHLTWEELSLNDWKSVCLKSFSAWKYVEGELFDLFCDIFDEIEINETFSLIKRFVLPRTEKISVLNNL
jgi:hypothetical protein